MREESHKAAIQELWQDNSNQRDMKENTMKNKSKVSSLTLDGHWFVYFGTGLVANGPKVEGNKIVEITGTYDSDELLDLLSKKVFDSLTQDIKDLISKNNLTLVIRSLSKLD